MSTPALFRLTLVLCALAIAVNLGDAPLLDADEGRNADENPGTLADARARIDEALAFLDTLDAEAFDQPSADQALVLTLPMGLTFDLKREQFVRDWALGQFYFHVMAAYAILRKEGIEIGKADYVPHMFAYERPAAKP